MAIASDYGVSFGYGAQDGVYYGPNGSVGKYHRGNDRPTPIGTPIVISGTTIGWTGNTGLVSGPHLHTQAMYPGTNTDLNPTPYEFRPGAVVEAGWHNQFGNFVKIRVNSIDLIYAHQSKINVAVGQQVGQPQGGTEMINTREEAVGMYQMLRPNGSPSEAEIGSTVGKRSFAGFVRDASAEIAQRNAAIQGQAQVLAQAQTQVADLKIVLSNLEGLRTQTDIDFQAKNAAIQTLQAEADTKTRALNEALNEVQRLHDTACKMPDEQPQVPETFGFLAKLLSIFVKKS